MPLFPIGFDISADLGVAKKKANFQRVPLSKPLRPRDTVEADSADGLGCGLG